MTLSWATMMLGRGGLALDVVLGGGCPATCVTHSGQGREAPVVCYFFKHVAAPEYDSAACC